MSEIVVRLDEIESILEPVFGNNVVRIVLDNKGAYISPMRERKSTRGMLHKYANPDIITGEKGAWERAVVKKYADT